MLNFLIFLNCAVIHAIEATSVSNSKWEDQINSNSFTLPLSFEYSPLREPIRNTFNWKETGLAFVNKAAQTLDAFYSGGSPVTTVTVGNQKLKLLLDTGSYVTWASNYDSSKSSTFSISPNIPKSFSYADGSSVSCTLHTDTFNFGQNISLPNEICQVSAASGTFSFTAFDGIMGIGPSSTVFASLAAAGYSSISFWFNTTNMFTTGTTGQINFGDLDTTRFTGQLLSLPATKTQTARWQVSAEGVVADNGNIVYQFPSGIEFVIDTGTNFMYLPQEAVDAININTLGAQRAEDGSYTISCSSISSTNSLSFFIGGSKTPVTIPYQLLFIPLSNSRSTCQSIIRSSDQVSNQFLIGVFFLHNFYLSYDYSKSLISLGTLASQNSQLVGSVISGPPRPASLDQVAQSNSGLLDPSRSTSFLSSSKLFWVILAACLSFLLLFVGIFFYLMHKYPSFRSAVVHVLYRTRIESNEKESRDDEGCTPSPSSPLEGKLPKDHNQVKTTVVNHSFQGDEIRSETIPFSVAPVALSAVDSPNFRGVNVPFIGSMLPKTGANFGIDGESSPYLIGVANPNAIMANDPITRADSAYPSGNAISVKPMANLPTPRASSPKPTATYNLFAQNSYNHTKSSPNSNALPFAYAQHSSSMLMGGSNSPSPMVRPNSPVPVAQVTAQALNDSSSPQLAPLPRRNSWVFRAQNNQMVPMPIPKSNSPYIANGPTDALPFQQPNGVPTLQVIEAAFTRPEMSYDRMRGERNCSDPSMYTAESENHMILPPRKFSKSSMHSENPNLLPPGKSSDVSLNSQNQPSLLPRRPSSFFRGNQK